MATSRLARAKVNLCLHVTGQRGDGYHLLDSIVCFANYGDLLTFEPADAVSLTIDGPFADGLSGQDDNLILRAARCFQAPTGCAIHLRKNLPIASGIGGGSADAAAALHGLVEHWQLPMRDGPAQLSLGADVPVCVQGQAVRMQGIGEDLLPLPGWPDLPAVLVNPGVAVSTPKVFSALKSKRNPGLSGPLVGLPSQKETVAWLSQNRNDLEPAAIACAPTIGSVLDALRFNGAELARMSGSGATCFGLYATEAAAQSAAVELQAVHPKWWVQATVFCGSHHAGHNEIRQTG
ncbi:MAG: 4-(cytidine 5'-diphospho)-2-C-methyl-D-erythritol kinase [Rhodobacteraceae bacterium]|nr:4-(cytidine 5'-diphospho)-2-C-methyl-D-erythritol kinase [Paracoccaceae bacterium]